MKAAIALLCLSWMASAQEAAPDWQIAAGGKMQFEAASVRLDTGPFRPPSFALSSDDSFVDTGGLFHADFPLVVYIQFAYKLWPSREQTEAMLATVPKWISTDRYLIEARAEGHPTKDQYRLMLQSLLAERFGLKLHLETREMSVYAMELARPGKLGPRLHPHSEGPACDAALPAASNNEAPVVFPPICDAFMMRPLPNHDMLMGSRDTTMDLVASSLTSLGAIGRPVVDRTGLTGRYDFSVEFAREVPAAPGSSTAGPATAADAPGSPFLEAAQEQLGVKLEATKAQLTVPIVDHVERPSEN